jgi:hypothetical protein
MMVAENGDIVEERKSRIPGRRESDMEQEPRYVTFPWLVGSFLTVAAMVISISLFTIGYFSAQIDKNAANFNAQLEKKVDKDSFKFWCDYMISIKDVVEKNATVTEKIDRNQIRVMQKMDLKP